MKDVVAIDGPAGAGKSTVARLTAREIGYRYVDTGAMYRAVALLALNSGVPCDDDDRVAALASQAQITFKDDDNSIPLVILNGDDVTATIRLPEVSRHVSLVARIPAVRRHLTFLQQQMALGGRVVMEGRDIGTVVVPDARHKFFITASAHERAVRRQLELSAAGHAVPLETLVQDIARRDSIDSTREVAPLRPADDAVIIDTTGLSVKEVLAIVVREVGNT